VSAAGPAVHGNPACLSFADLAYFQVAGIFPVLAIRIIPLIKVFNRDIHYDHR
jgi:hypothetical protein